MDKNELPELRVSHSSLSWLEKSPQYFQAMLNGTIPKEESASMDFGKAFHCYILRNKDFSSEFYVIEGQQPTTMQQKRFCELISVGTSQIDSYKASYSTKGRSDKSVETDADLMGLNFKTYIDSLKDVGERKVITKYDYDKIVSVANNVFKHEAVQALFDYKDKHSTAEVFIEHEFLYNGRKLHDNKEVYVHGFIDHMIFDAPNRKIIITELKTSSQDINNYLESFLKYKTNRQLGIYSIAAGKMFQEMYPDVPLKEVSTEWNVILAQTNFLNECRFYKIGEEHIINGIYEYKDLLNRYVFHYEKGWEYPQEYYTNKGVEYL